MRVALVSDIHGNLVSLEAVLADIAQKQVDRIVCLGDVPMFGPQPGQVLARLREMNCLCVMGNHDLELLDMEKALAEAEGPPPVADWMEWCASRLVSSDLDYLASWQPMIEVPLDTTTTVLCFHGSPRSNMDLILAATPAAELDEMLAGHSAQVMAGGHTHLQMLRRHDDVLVVNAGSVGWPLEQMPFEGMPRFMPWSEYAIVNWIDGKLGVELYRIPIDLVAIRKAVLDSGMPHADFWMSQWITQEGA